MRQIKAGDECILKIQDFLSDLIRGITSFCSYIRILASIKTARRLSLLCKLYIDRITKICIDVLRRSFP